jgi:hypothetical protein
MVMGYHQIEMAEEDRAKTVLARKRAIGSISAYILG